MKFKSTFLFLIIIITLSNLFQLINAWLTHFSNFVIDPTLGSGSESASLGYPNHSACPAGTRCLRSNSYQWGSAATPSAQTTSNPWQYACYECANNCDCKPGYYCRFQIKNFSLYFSFYFPLFSSSLFRILSFLNHPLICLFINFSNRFWNESFHHFSSWYSKFTNLWKMSCYS